MAGSKEPVGDQAAKGQQRSRYDGQIPVRVRTASDLLEDCARLILDDGTFIGSTELRILGLLAEHEGLSISEISRNLFVDKAWISRRIKLLADMQLVQLDRHDMDSRLLLARLTDEGRSRFARTMQSVTPVYAEIVAGMDEAATITLLDRLECNLRNLNARLRQMRSADAGESSHHLSKVSGP